jgi:ABC-2 type transport system permease protein
MKLLLSETLIALKLSMRDRQTLFWTLLFPLLLLVLFVSAFGGGNPRAASGVLSGVICISIFTATLFGIGIVIASVRDEGILRRYKITPLPKWVFVFGTVMSRYIVLLFSTAVLILAAEVFYHIEIVGGVFALFIVFTVGTASFSALGFAVASFAQTAQSAVWMANVLIMPMILLSGATIPSYVLPVWINEIALGLPSTYLYDAFEEVIVFGGGVASIWADLAVLMVFLTVAAALSVKLFRWE